MVFVAMSLDRHIVLMSVVGEFDRVSCHLGQSIGPAKEENPSLFSFHMSSLTGDVMSYQRRSLNTYEENIRIPFMAADDVQKVCIIIRFVCHPVKFQRLKLHHPYKNICEYCLRRSNLNSYVAERRPRTLRCVSESQRAACRILLSMLLLLLLLRHTRQRP